MTTYADPTRCPDCRAVLPQDPQVCRVCSLPLTGETAVSLLRTFQEADRLLGVLRAQRRPAAALVGAATAVTGSRLDGVAPYPAPSGPHPAQVPDAPRLPGASVPKILLSLGALCLLVAAVTFLAVAWSWLGVGGRTVVLVALTGSALGVSAVMHRRGLRMAAESLSVVGLGLLALDVVGARHADWLGQVDDARLTLLTGSVVAAGALVMLVVSAARPLHAPALIAPLGVLVATIGSQAHTTHPVALVIAPVVLLALGRVGTLLPSATLSSASIGCSAPIWLLLLVVGVDRAGDPITAAHHIGDGAGWPFLAATLIAAAVGPVTGAHRSITRGGYAVAGLVGSYAVVLPVLDNAPTGMVAVLLGVSLVWVVVVAAGPRTLRAPALLPLGGVLIVPAVYAARLAAEAVRVLSVGDPFSRPFGVHVLSSVTEGSPLLLVPTALTLALTGCAVAGLVDPVRRSTCGIALAGTAVVGGLATLSLYDVPLAVVVGTVLVVAVAAFVAAELLAASTADDARIVVLALVATAAVLALPSDRMTAGVLLVGCAMACYLLPRTDSTGAIAAFVFPIAFAGLVWSTFNVLGLHADLRAVPVLVVLGGLAIWRPQLELETSSAIVGSVTSAAAIAMARDTSVALAVHLTVAGVLVTASSIINPSRRWLAWPGGLLLAAATWVRLLDLGVHVPEAYTLPSALTLVAVGAWRLRRDDRSATLTVLAPGLTLATVPSLLAMLDDPYSLRALLLGAACVVLAVTGTVLRWSAPLVVGASVGTLLVLREFAPYAAQVPTWLSIGLSGAGLLVVGITWESRMNDVRRASQYVGALR
ncbi:SCO7613 C-terminal domain-containing membrane protein [Nocardioides sp.]|uniref:SCO7613 C-terminal domain-containing membrane protein n=1 Tax=Nocardioides sp. TaxID=35761 RepID=UPI002F899B47